MEAADLLLGGGLLLGAVALSGIFFRQLRQSAIPAFILLGLALRPVIGESPTVELLGIFGVVLLLFFMGLEFSFGALLAGRHRLVAHGLRDLVITFPVGLIAALLLGWGLLGAIFLAGAFYISSSAIIAKSIIELRRTANPETERVLGILVFEDIAIALLLAVLSGVVLARGEFMAGLVGVARALAFFGAVIVLARVGRPMLNRLLDTEDDDLFLLLMGAALLLLCWAAVTSGLSEAIGAFLAGSLMAGTVHKERIESLFAPLQGLFAALFFVAFGLSIDVESLAGVLLPGAVLIVLAVATKLAVGWWIGAAEGMSRRASFALGVTLIPRGEFSIVLAGIATAAGFERMTALIALLVLVLSLLGTTAIRGVSVLSDLLFRGRREPTLKERGFRTDLADDTF